MDAIGGMLGLVSMKKCLRLGSNSVHGGEVRRLNHFFKVSFSRYVFGSRRNVIRLADKGCWLCRFIALVGMFCLFNSGCVSTNVSTDQALSSLRAGDDPNALAWSEKLKHSFYSKNLGYLETGRVRMLSGDFLGSSTNFGAVIDQIIDKSENGPVLKMGSVGANVMAGTITDDRTRAYDVPPYEFIQSLHYQMLNDLFLGNLEAAGVEARRAVFAQDAIAEKYGKEVKDAQARASDAKNQAALGKVDAQMQSMAPVIEMTRSSFENGLAWYLCGVLFEQQNDLSNASLSYRKAWELVPGNPYVQKDFLRLIRTQDQEMYKGLVAQAGIDPKTLVRSRTEVLLIVEESFVSQRQSVKIPLPIPGINTLTSVDFPMYQDPAYQPMALEVREKDASCGLSAMALSVQSLAYRDLKEKIPGIVVRNVTRVATQLAAQAAVNASGNDYAKVAVLLVNVGKTLLTRADTRAWYTLPMVTHLFRSGVAPGEHLFELRNPVTGYVTRFPVKVAEGETRIIWVADIGGNARVATASLNGKGGPTTFQVCGSMLAGAPAMTVPGGPRLIGGVTPAARVEPAPAPETPAVPAPVAVPQAVVPVPAVPVEQPIIIPMTAPAPAALPVTVVPAAATETAVAQSAAQPSLQKAPPAVRLPGERGLSVTHAKGANWGVPVGGAPLQLVGEKKGYKQ